MELAQHRSQPRTRATLVPSLADQPLKLRMLRARAGRRPDQRKERLGAGRIEGHQSDVMPICAPVIGSRRRHALRASGTEAGNDEGNAHLPYSQRKSRSQTSIAWSASCARARSRAARPRRRRRSRSRARRMMASAVAFASSTGTISPPGSRRSQSARKGRVRRRRRRWEVRRPWPPATHSASLRSARSSRKAWRPARAGKDLRHGQPNRCCPSTPSLLACSFSSSARGPSPTSAKRQSGNARDDLRPSGEQDIDAFLLNQASDGDDGRCGEGKGLARGRARREDLGKKASFSSGTKA